MKNLAELQAECIALGIEVRTKGRASKTPFIEALRDFFWRQVHPNEPCPPQVEPMLLENWDDLTEDEAATIEADGSGWCVQQKLDGVRALLHVERDGVRLTSRTISETNYRLGEFQQNVPHLTDGFKPLVGTILDGELLCPSAAIETGATLTENALQATMAILATTPANAQCIQSSQNAKIIFHAFDILKFRGEDTTQRQLLDRLDALHEAVRTTRNSHVVEVPAQVVGKATIHVNLLKENAEGSVWKRLDSRYEPNRRTCHWLKRKRALSVTAFVSDFKSGTPGRGNSDLVGALEFSHQVDEGRVAPIGWISSWSDAERKAMTSIDPDGGIRLNPAFLGKKAIVTGQDLSARCQRLRHARLVCWLDT